MVGVNIKSEQAADNFNNQGTPTMPGFVSFSYMGKLWTEKKKHKGRRVVKCTIPSIISLRGTTTRSLTVPFSICSCKDWSLLVVSSNIFF